MKMPLRYISLALILVTIAIPSKGTARKEAKDARMKTATETAGPVHDKKTPYEKFANAKGTARYPGVINLYMDRGGKIWAEIPDSLLGREFLFDQITKAEGDPTAIDGRCIAKNLIYRIERRDSSILFTTSDASAYAGDARDPGVANAIRQSSIRTTAFRIPIKCVSKDSCSFVFDIGKVLTPDKSNTRLKGLKIGDMTVSSGSPDSKKSGKPVPVTFGNSFGLKREVSFKCTGAVAIFQSEGTFNSTVQTTLTLLPKITDIPYKKADGRIGTYNVTRTVFSSTGKNINDKVISRWDLSDGKFITVYVDTLLSPTMYKAVREGLMEWNSAFVDAGMGVRIVAMPFDKNVNVDDPLVSSVRFCGGTGSVISGVVRRHEDGRILSFQIGIPRHLSDLARRDASMLIGDVDDRFHFQHEQDEEAVAEIARARVMKLTGNALGLADNLAGSRAYSPEQLGNPKFTQLYGISASVTDDVLFNYFAKPGDKERGLVLINDRLGEYDRYAISWIYGDGQIDNKREHLYVGAARGGWPDPRGIRDDLSSDVLASYDAVKNHLQNCIPTMKEWKKTECPNLSEGDDLLIDWIFLNNWYALASLSKQVGGVGANEMHQAPGRPKFEPVPPDVQRECTIKMLNMVDEISYIQKDREFLLLFGPNRNVTDYMKMNVQGMLLLANRLPKILAACDLGGSKFTAADFMNLIQESMLRNVSKGYLNEYEDIKLANYISVLAGMGEVTAVNLKETCSGHRLFSADGETDRELAPEFRADIGSTPARYYNEAELIAYRYLKKTAEALKSSRNLFSDENQGSRMDYLIYLADAALGNKRK